MMDLALLEKDLSANGVCCRGYRFNQNILKVEDKGYFDALKLWADRVRDDFEGGSFVWEDFSGVRNCVLNAVSVLSNKNKAIAFGESSLERAGSDSKLVFLVHGLFQNEGAFLRLMKLFSTEDYLPFAVGYDYRRSFEECVGEVSEKITRVAKKIPCRDKIFAIGHSTGADVLRYAANLGALEDVRGFVFSAPLTNGKFSGFFGNYEDYANFSCSGRKVVPKLQEKVTAPHITLSGLKDRFIPLYSSLDFKGDNVVLRNFGHIAGSGCNRHFNRVYLELLKFLSDGQVGRENE